MTQIVESLRRAQVRSGKSLKDLSLAVGKSPGYLSELFSGRGNRDIGASTLVQLCRELDLSVDEIAGLSPTFKVVPRDDDFVQRQAARLMTDVLAETKRRLETAVLRPAVEDVIAWWRRENGILRDFDRIAPVIDLYAPVESGDGRIRPKRLGGASLASVWFGVESQAQLSRVIDILDADLTERLVISYAKAGEGPLVSMERMDYHQGNAESPLRVEYMRALLPVSDETGRRFILNFSKPLAP